MNSKITFSEICVDYKLTIWQKFINLFVKIYPRSIPVNVSCEDFMVMDENGDIVPESEMEVKETNKPGVFELIDHTSMVDGMIVYKNTSSSDYESKTTKIV